MALRSVRNAALLTLVNLTKIVRPPSNRLIALVFGHAFRRAKQ